MKFIKRNGWFIVSLVLTGIIFFIIGMGSHPERGGAEQATPVQQIVIKDEGGFADAISRVANALMPAVVHIDVTGLWFNRFLHFRLVKILFLDISLVQCQSSERCQYVPWEVGL